VKYNIGDEVWVADFEAWEDRITCPDCLGKRQLRVIMGDDTVVAVDCNACGRGYMGPLGYITAYKRTPGTKLTNIMGIRMDQGVVTYDCYGAHGKKESEVYLTMEEAAQAAAEWAARLDREERDKIARKEKDTRSWAWNASYHRKEIKEAQRRIDYHSAKLAVAAPKAKAKEP
jgi:hypothetical protein